MLKRIPGFDDYYASENGKIYSGKSGKLKVKEIKQYSKTHDYLYVTLFKNGKRHYLRVNRVIALTFIPNPNNLPEVNHKDEDKTNNSVTNLEWCTSSYNKTYGDRSKKVAKKVSDPRIKRANNKSGYKGIWITKYNTYKVYFNRAYLGTYKTFDEALKVRKKAEQLEYDFF